MIDVHCHILPNLDDGADTMQTSLLMAAMAADDGVKEIIATPHITLDSALSSEKLHLFHSVFYEFCRNLMKSGIPVRCHLGYEILCTEHTNEILKAGLFPTIENTKYALVEFYFDEKLENMNQWLYSIKKADIIPIIAHPERYFIVQKNRAVLQVWAQQGYYIQVNKGSLYNQFGKKAQKTAEWILNKQLASFVATDAHGVYGRTTRFATLYSDLVRKYGPTYVNLLTEINPSLLLQNRKLNCVF